MIATCPIFLIILEEIPIVIITTPHAVQDFLKQANPFENRLFF